MKRFLRKIFLPKPYSLNNLLQQIDEVAKKSNILVICPEPTGNNWLGIKNATQALFPENHFIIPQNFSNQIVSTEDLEILIKRFQNAEGKTVVLSGFPDYFSLIAKLAKKYQLDVKTIFHGSFSEFANKKNNPLASMINLLNEGEVSSIGFIKKGLASTIKNLFEISCFELSLPVRNLKITEVDFNLDKSKVNIGIFGNSGFNKNRHNQVAASAMIDNSVIHIFEPNEFHYLLDDSRVRVHYHLNRNEFLSLLSQMDINLYTSFSESWGQVVAESLCVGVPCLASNNSGVLDFSRSLKADLILTENDNPTAIHDSIEKVLKAEFDLKNVQAEINAEADLKLKTFINS